MVGNNATNAELQKLRSFQFVATPYTPVPG